MNRFPKLRAVGIACWVLALPYFAAAQAPIPPSITTPDKVETRIGTLDFKDGVPSKATFDKVYDNLDFTHAFEAFANTFQGVSIARHPQGPSERRRQGQRSPHLLRADGCQVAVPDRQCRHRSTSSACSTSPKGPWCSRWRPRCSAPSTTTWFRWVIDFGLPGPDRGEGGKYLILPPGYDGPLPEGGFSVARARTNFVIWFARSFLENNDPKPVAESIRKFTKIYPYEAGGVGTPIAEFLAGKAKLGRSRRPPPTVFHEGSGKVMNTIPPNDFSFFEMLNEVVQQEPATSLDPELMGPLAAIGIIKGKPFAPDARMKKILTEAARARQRHLAHPVHGSSRSGAGSTIPARLG